LLSPSLPASCTGGGRALAVTRGDPEQLPQVLWRDCIARARPALERLAQPVDAKATWDDLQLPAEEMTLLHRIADQVEHRAIVYDDWGFRRRMNRGFGISVLFAGESGTGKTMAAEVIANALGLSLYRIDLSAVVDKYIGETEKNLRRLFDAAEEGGCILLFDEADALFGKRSEVKDSHDRYSNIEVNYLLQRMEGFGGLAILATNMKTALDGAFLRRLRFIVKFPFPGVAERRAIWARAFPDEAQPGVLDLDRLARFALSGGSIQNIAMNAAFAAAAGSVQVSMPLLLDAVRTEFRKLDKPVNENDLRWLESAGGQA
jgi:SpoVK/Ycf46/Vps4 family AAA+-type ATPase